jgi:hypothetical protein
MAEPLRKRQHKGCGRSPSLVKPRRLPRTGRTAQHGLDTPGRRTGRGGGAAASSRHGAAARSRGRSRAQHSPPSDAAAAAAAKGAAAIAAAGVAAAADAAAADAAASHRRVRCCTPRLAPRPRPLRPPQSPAVRCRRLARGTTPTQMRLRFQSHRADPGCAAPAAARAGPLPRLPQPRATLQTARLACRRRRCHGPQGPAHHRRTSRQIAGGPAPQSAAAAGGRRSAAAPLPRGRPRRPPPGSAGRPLRRRTAAAPAPPRARAAQPARGVPRRRRRARRGGARARSRRSAVWGAGGGDGGGDQGCHQRSRTPQQCSPAVGRPWGALKASPLMPTWVRKIRSNAMVTRARPSLTGFAATGSQLPV